LALEASASPEPSADLAAFRGVICGLSPHMRATVPLRIPATLYGRLWSSMGREFCWPSWLLTNSVFLRNIRNVFVIEGVVLFTAIILASI